MGLRTARVPTAGAEQQVPPAARLHARGPCRGAEPPRSLARDHPRRTAFVGALTDDLNTPAALAQAEAVLDLAATGDVATKRHALEVLFDMDQVLALSLRERASDADLSSEERAALGERDEARKTGDYKRSDELRAELERKYGIRVKDTKDGTRWERIRRKGA